MKTDRYRITGPEKSVVPISSTKLQKFDPLNRVDGRPMSQIRPLFSQTGILSQASGSAFLEMGDSKIICAVYVEFVTVDARIIHRIPF